MHFMGRVSLARASLAGLVWQAPAKGDLPKETCQSRPGEGESAGGLGDRFGGGWGVVML